MILLINDVLAFIIELYVLYLIGRWTFQISDNSWLSILLVILAISLFAIIWGSFFSPQARFQLPTLIYSIGKFVLLAIPFLQFRSQRPILMIFAWGIILLQILIQVFAGRYEW